MDKVVEYVYDIDGLRVSKTVGGTKRTDYVFDLSGKILEEAGAEESVQYVFLKERHLARVEKGEVLFYGTDHLSSTILMTDSKGIPVWTADASPFGDFTVVSSDSYSNLGLKFTGKDSDETTGLYYFNARWYDPELGRFITEDPARDGDNWYGYCRQNPIRYVDPSGLYSKDEIRAFKKSSAVDQLKFLKTEIEGVSNAGNDVRGKKADEMRDLRNSMKLGKLFKLDDEFMDEGLRDFLNLNVDGTTAYSYEKISEDMTNWTELCSIGSQYHQTSAGEKLNAKFVNKDGREVVFDSQHSVVTNEKDRGTYNYVNGTAFSSILWGGHKLFDMDPYTRKFGDTPKRSHSFWSGGAFKGNSKYWEDKK